MNLEKSRRILLAAVLFGILSVTGCNLLPKEEVALAPPLTQPKKQEYQLYDVKKTDFTKYIKGTATLVSITENDVYSKQNGGRIMKINVKFGDIVKKGDVLVELNSDNLENELKLEKINMQRVKFNYDKAQQGNDEYAKKLAELDIEAEKIKLGELEDKLEATKLTAPISGKITFVESAKEGDVVEVYKPLVTVANPDSLQILFTQNGTSNAKLGMNVELNYNGKNYQGQITQIPDSGKNKNAIIITPNSKIHGAKMDDYIDISIIVQTRKNTLVIPKAAVKNYLGSKTVEVLDGDKNVSTDIETGIEDSVNIEVLSGLNEGQKVILR